MLPVILTIIILILDRFTKVLVINNLSLYDSIAVVRGIFHITLVHNTGAAFGLLQHQVPLFVGTSLFAVALIIRELRRKPKHRLYAACLSLILAGALGNLIDRLWYGYVIDFIDLRVWPVFNVADSAISIGVCILAYLVLTGKDKSK
jgi:signal peptidase II